MIDLSEVAGHVLDGPEFHLPAFLGGHYHLPKVLGIQVTRYMALEAVAGVGMLVVFLLMARRVSGGKTVRGRFWNLIEVMLLFLRDQVARPAIGRHDADRFLPLIWNMFFFVLFCNLLGMLPWAGSPTGSLAVTAAMAVITLGTVVGAGMVKFGPVGFWTSLVPHMDLPKAMAILLLPMLLIIEIAGLFIRHGVLAVRLLANMFAGHMVLAVIVGFIAAAAQAAIALWLTVTIASVLGAAMLSLLELFVAFLQAYIFAFLSALFIGMAVHPH